MRNLQPQKRSIETLPSVYALFCLGVMLTSLWGCAGDPKLRDSLQAGYSALERHSYTEAAANAQTVLRTNATGPEAAEALYLEGRIYQDRPKADQAATAADLQQARTCYRQALDLPASPNVEALIRAGVGTVAFNQEDYATAAEQLIAACDKLPAGHDKAASLYQAGVALQRLGRFHEADAAFNLVIEQFPTSDMARAASAHVGISQFYVQVATFSTAAAADKLVNDLRRQAIIATHLAGNAANSPHIVRAGPFTTYDQARRVKIQCSASFPDAIIQP